MSWFSDGQSWSYDQLEYHAGRTVEYVRGSASTGSITATAAEVEYDVFDRDGYQTTFLSRDYFVKKASLLIAGQQVEPRAGDRIKETIGGESTYFVVVPINSRPFSELKGDGLRYRIHTKRVE